MKILTTRRICQIFFFTLFIWFCVVTTLGEQWRQLRGWPANWFIQLDPLVGLGTLLTTRTLYAGLLWGLATVVLTIILGRFFCGWLCPLGSIHQFIGYLAKRKKSVKARLELNRYHPAQSLKYWILVFLLSMAAAELAIEILRLPHTNAVEFAAAFALAFAAVVILVVRRISVNAKKAFAGILAIGSSWVLISFLFPGDWRPVASLQIGLLDPISLVYRSINLIMLPLIDRTTLVVSSSPRLYAGTGLIAAIFLVSVLLNLIRPRFYCRFVCPLGALFGVIGRFAIWRIGKIRDKCNDCVFCQQNCEGACQPTKQIRIAECVLCLNCMSDCYHRLMGYNSTPSASGETLSPDLSRREFLTAAVSGAAAIPMLRIGGNPGPYWNPNRVRPPGSLPEEQFLSRCIKCGQCMRICPTNVIHPAGLAAGLEGLWTPVLNFRLGTSGCQHNCIACGNLCPTAAIRPISLEERQGINRYASQGPIKIGTAFIDRGRCLPWAMDRPCIVCQENCPVSPKAIFTREQFNIVRLHRPLIVKNADSTKIEFESDALVSGQYATGDYFCMVQQFTDPRPRRIIANSSRSLEVDGKLPFVKPPQPQDSVSLQIRLQQPYVDPKLCIGCGVCEHECPVRGRRAIRVTAENESRSREHALIVQS
jgi:polyferredoxin/formate hydrogenlyase subunit 6/NADH:ubiquinone oxidoreductase subunit I